MTGTVTLEKTWARVTAYEELHQAWCDGRIGDGQMLSARHVCLLTENGDLAEYNAIKELAEEGQEWRTALERLQHLQTQSFKLERVIQEMPHRAHVGGDSICDIRRFEAGRISGMTLGQIAVYYLMLDLG